MVCDVHNTNEVTVTTNKRASRATPLNLLPEFERGLVVLALRDPSLWEAIVQHIEPESLALPAAVRAIQALHAMRDDDVVCTSPVALVQYIATTDSGRVPRDDLRKFSDELLSWVVPDGLTSRNVIDLVAPLLRTHVDHRIALASAKAIVDGNHAQVRSLLAQREAIGFNVSNRSVELTHAFSSVRELRINERLPFGVPDLDQATDGGLWLGAVGLVIGGYGGGKSIALTQQGASAYLNCIDTAFISLELPASMQYARFLSCITGVPSKRIADGSLEDEARSRLERLVDSLGGRAPFFSVEELSRGAKPSDIYAAVDNIEQRRGRPVRALVVDYLDEMEPEKSAPSDYVAMRRVCQSLANYAGKGSVRRWVWTASQAQRHDKNASKTKRITGDNVADSINKLRVVDMALAYNVGEGQESVDIHLSKYRLGAAGFWIGPLPVNFACARIGGFSVPPALYEAPRAK